MDRVSTDPLRLRTAEPRPRRSLPPPSVIVTPYGRPVTRDPQDSSDHQKARPEGHRRALTPPAQDQADDRPAPDHPVTPTSTVTVFLVRHGETPMHAENRFVGRTDVGLTNLGHAQADELAEWAATARLTAVVSSPLRRAHETAEPAARKTGVNVVVDERLVELDFGAADGLTAAEMRERFPAERAAFEADPYANPLPGGEPPAAALQRGRAALEDLGGGAGGNRVLVVAHGTFLRIVLCDLLGIAPANYRRVFPVTPNATGAVLRRYGPGRWGLLAWNPRLGAGTHAW